MAVIVVDGVKLSGKPCGLSSIAMAIIESLAKNNEHKIIVLMKEQPRDEVLEVLTSYKTIDLAVVQPPILKSISIYWSLFVINNLVKKYNPDLFIAPNFLLSPYKFNSKIKTVVFVHDVVNKEFANTMHWFNRLHMFLLFRYSLNKANLIWCNSNYTRVQILKYYNKTVKNKKFFVGSGINLKLQEIANKQYEYNQSQYKVQKVGSKPYILYVGTIEPRKNVTFLLKLFAKLNDQFDLVMIGGAGWGEEQKEVDTILNSYGYPYNQITRVSNIPTQQLVSYYKSAAFLISTSFNEGLGLPVLEAMACSCPVIVPHNSAFVEVAHGVGLTIEGWQLESWLSGIMKLNADRGFYVARGLEKVKEYQWPLIVDRFLKLL